MSVRALSRDLYLLIDQESASTGLLGLMCYPMLFFFQ